jgi:hypothetical protein
MFLNRSKGKSGKALDSVLKMKPPRIGERNDQTPVNVHNNLSREADFFVAILNDVRLRYGTPGIHPF